MFGFTSQTCNSPKMSQTEKRRRVRRAAPGSSRWTQRSMGTGGGSATRNPGRGGKLVPLGEACCWSRLTGRSAAGMGDPPGTATGWPWAKVQSPPHTHTNTHQWFLTAAGHRMESMMAAAAQLHVYFTSAWAHLKPVSFHQALKAPDGPAGWIQDDLGQGSHLQRGVRPFCTVNKNRRPLPETMGSQLVAPPSLLRYFLRLWDRWGHFPRWPVDTLGSEAGGGQDLFDVTLPAGSFKFAQPAVHVVRLVVTRLHELDKALLEDIKPGKMGESKLLMHSFRDNACTGNRQQSISIQPQQLHTSQLLYGSSSTVGSWPQTQSLHLELWPAGPHQWCACRWCNHACPAAGWHWSVSHLLCISSR